VRLWLIAAVGIGLGLTSLLAVQAILLGDLLARLFRNPVGLRSVAIELGGLLAATAARALLLAVSTKAGSSAANRVRGELRHDGLAAVLERGPAWLSGEQAGELAVTLGRGLDALDAYVGEYLPRLVLAVLSPLVLLAIIGYLDWLSLLILLVALSLVPLFMLLVGQLTRERVARRWSALTRLGAHFLDAVEGLATLRAFGRAHLQERQIAEVTDDLRRTTLAVLREAFLSALVLETLAAVGTALVAVPLAIRLLEGQMTLAPALTILVLTPEVFLPLRRASSDFHAAAEGLSATDRILEIIRPNPGPTATTAPMATVRGQGQSGGTAGDGRAVALSFHGVTISYPGHQRPAIDRVDLDVARGERVALVGPSGAGKSTLLSAALALRPLSAGWIVAGDLIQGETDPHRWRRDFAFVPHHPHLFAGTLADNLRLGSAPPTGSDGDAAELAWALEVAQLAELVQRLPEGVDTDLGVHGQRLSAGERQRVAIARALLRRGAHVLILDEPTAHLDGVSEALLVASLDRALGKRTLLVATHRPRWIELTDTVVHLGNGRLVDTNLGPRSARFGGAPRTRVESMRRGQECS
jgi:ATP-binding cassette subfamily C protein CydD